VHVILFCYEHILPRDLSLSESYPYYSELDRFGSSTIPGHLKKKYLFFQNDIVFQYFYSPVIFPNLLATVNFMLDVAS